MSSVSWDRLLLVRESRCLQGLQSSRAICANVGFDKKPRIRRGIFRKGPTEYCLHQETKRARSTFSLNIDRCVDPLKAHDILRMIGLFKSWCKKILEYSGLTTQQQQMPDDFVLQKSPAKLPSFVIAETFSDGISPHQVVFSIIYQKLTKIVRISRTL